MNNELVDLIISTAHELNDQEEVEITSEIDKNTELFGRSGILDSMGLVSLVVAVEQVIEEKYNVSVSLADEKALSQKNSPFRTVATLAEYAESLIDAERGNG